MPQVCQKAIYSSLVYLFSLFLSACSLCLVASRACVMDSLLYLILTPFCNSHQHLSSLCLPLLASLILYPSGCRAVVVSVMLVVEMEHRAVLQTSPVLRRAGDSFSVSSPATRFMLRCICHWFSCTALVYQGYRLITSIFLHAVLQPMSLQRSWRSTGWSIFLYGICFVKNCKCANLQVIISPVFDGGLALLFEASLRSSLQAFGLLLSLQPTLKCGGAENNAINTDKECRSPSILYWLDSWGSQRNSGTAITTICLHIK